MAPKYSHRRHFSEVHGGICRCPWGARGSEHVGKTAAKIDWLRDRPDMQTDEGKAFLDFLEERGYTAADKLLPWIVREWKKKRLQQSSGVNRPRHLYYHSLGEPFDLSDEQGHNYAHSMFQARDAERIQKALDDMSKHRKGLDVMQHKAHELFPKVKEFIDWQKENDRMDRGTILHPFDDGWSVRRIDNAEEAKIEGEDMGHCIGQYGRQIEAGDGLFVSLRDHRGKPHATMELYGHDVDEDGKPIPADRMSVEQFYGKEDAPPLEEYQDRMNEWLEPYGVDASQAAFEPWWPEEYEVEGPENYTELEHYANYGPDEYAPDDYHSACADAEEHGLDYPYLTAGTPKWESILEDVLQPGRHIPGRGYVREQVPYDPEKGARIYELATGERHPDDGNDAVYHNGNWQNESAELGDALADYHDAALDDYRDQSFTNIDQAKAYWQAHPYGAMLDHLLAPLDDTYQPPWKQAIQPHPQQTMLWHPPNPDLTWQDWPQDTTPLTYQHYGSTGVAPLYYRWAFDPQKGVTLSSNDEDLDFRLPYHRDLGGGSAQVNGYAYRIRGGWRVTDWEHQPVEDPFVISSVVKALNGKDGKEDRLSRWEAPAYDWDRLHYGLPMARLEWSDAIFED